MNAHLKTRPLFKKSKEYDDMNLVVINGRHRNESESCQICRSLIESSFVIERFKKIDYVDLSAIDIPLWDEPQWSKVKSINDFAGVFSQLQAADAFIIVAPEWAGMASPGLMNLLMMCTSAEMGHKPALIVALSASEGGTNPVTQIRSYGYKNNHACYIPEHIIVDQGTGSFSFDDIDHSDEPCFVRARNALDLLKQYSIALQPIRDNDLINPAVFRYGS